MEVFGTAVFGMEVSEGAEPAWRSPRAAARRAAQCSSRCGPMSSMAALARHHGHRMQGCASIHRLGTTCRTVPRPHGLWTPLRNPPGPVTTALALPPLRTPLPPSYPSCVPPPPPTRRKCTPFSASQPSSRTCKQLRAGSASVPSPAYKVRALVFPRRSPSDKGAREPCIAAPPAAHSPPGPSACPTRAAPRRPHCCSPAAVRLWQRRPRQHQLTARVHATCGRARPRPAWMAWQSANLRRRAQSS